MVDFTAARRKMVDSQLRTHDVTDVEILNAMGSVERENFIPAARRSLSYLDDHVEVASSSGDAPARHLMAPSVMAKLLQAAEIQADDIVLVVGCTTGYAAAIVARLAGSVVALECDDALAEQASETLLETSADNAAVVTGPLADGWPKEGPYDVILLIGAVDQVPEALLAQLREGGRLVAVEGHGGSGVSRVHTRSAELVSSRFAFNASVPALPGFETKSEFVF